MTVRDTSRAAYHDILPELGARQKAVYEALKDSAATNTELSQRLGWPINTVTPRVNELCAKGLVTLVRRRKCSITGRTAIEWGVKRDTLF